MDVVRTAQWKNPVELKQAFPDIDPVKVKSKRTVYVCNIRRNEYRLVIAVHFKRGKVYTLRFLTHKDYDQTDWKDEL